MQELEFIPLAIVQAASYVKSRLPRYSLSQYLTDFQGSDREATKLLKKEAGYQSRDWEASNSILVTWQISFDYIRRTKPSAADLLSLMSFFDRHEIPEKLVRLQPETSVVSDAQLPDDSSYGEITESDDTPEFEDDIMTLRSYSLVSVSEKSASFTMHRLVQLTMRVWLKAYGQLDRWREKFISKLYDEFPTGEYEKLGGMPVTLSSYSVSNVSTARVTRIFVTMGHNPV